MCYYYYVCISKRYAIRCCVFISASTLFDAPVLSSLVFFYPPRDVQYIFYLYRRGEGGSVWCSFAFIKTVLFSSFIPSHFNSQHDSHVSVTPNTFCTFFLSGDVYLINNLCQNKLKNKRFNDVIQYYIMSSVSCIKFAFSGESKSRLKGKKVFTRTLSISF